MNVRNKQSFDRKMADRIGKMIERRYLRAAKEVHKEFSLMMLGEFAKATPVQSGNAAGAWTAAVDETPTSRASSISAAGKIRGRNLDTSKDAAKTVKRAKTAMRKAKIDSTISIGNSAHTKDKKGNKKYYIMQLENGKSKTQAPNGFFHRILPLAPSILKRAENNAKRRLKGKK